MNETRSKSSTRGGRREGAGRKPGLGPWGEKTIPVRIPVSQKQNVLAFLHRQKTQPAASLPAEAWFPAIEPVRLSVPLFSNRIAAGFPSPADDYIENRLDLNQLLIRNPAARRPRAAYYGYGHFHLPIIDANGRELALTTPDSACHERASAPSS